FQAIIDELANKHLIDELRLVFSNKSDDYILQIAADYNIPTKYIPDKGLTREQYEELVVDVMQKYNHDLYLLKGSMRN
ncbi:phosphoribosylglycinamide formyltransferase, partial [Francisella tularensis subsp. holarctica]|uniref:formyltransferase family protein n=1 Tax=Francisella tularensis TaxID=263 RepID=UPI002381B0E9